MMAGSVEGVRRKHLQKIEAKLNWVDIPWKGR